MNVPDLPQLVNCFLKRICFCFFLAAISPVTGQTGDAPTLRFDFNDHRIREINDRVQIKPYGVILTEDRFGNRESAIYFFGNVSSFINLGNSDLLKPKRGTIALWVNIQERIFAGKGFISNTILMMKNGPGEDFIMGFIFSFNPITSRFGSNTGKDSIYEATINSKDTVKLNTWHHLLSTYDDDYLAFYVDGVLQARVAKGFESKFVEGDSVVLGRTMGTKNIRFTNAIFDDLCFYHRVLNEQEIKDLYNEPNPNRLKLLFYEVMKYGIGALILAIIIIILLRRNKTNLRKQREQYELRNKIKELEIKVIKTQMNPHFISNCLSAIQNLIYSGQIDKAGEYLAKFNVFVRQVLDSSDKNYLSLLEELEMMRLNIELEQLRFSDEFTFTLHIEEGISLNETLIPALITQPFIENAIWHGLLPLKDQRPNIIVSVYTQNGIVHLAIEDNGVGRANATKTVGKNSRGMRLAIDKIESINQSRNNPDFKLEIIDLFSPEGAPTGTKIIIQLSPYTLDE